MLSGNPEMRTGAIWFYKLGPDSLYLKKLKFREGKLPPQSHTAINWQSWDWNSSLQVFPLVWCRAYVEEGSRCRGGELPDGSAGTGSWKALDATKQKS